MLFSTNINTSLVLLHLFLPVVGAAPFWNLYLLFTKSLAGKYFDISSYEVDSKEILPNQFFNSLHRLTVSGGIWANFFSRSIAEQINLQNTFTKTIKSIRGFPEKICRKLCLIKSAEMKNTQNQRY